MTHSLYTATEIAKMHEFVKKHGLGLYAVWHKPTGIGEVVCITNPDGSAEEDVTEYAHW